MVRVWVRVMVRVRVRAAEHGGAQQKPAAPAAAAGRASLPP